MCKGPEVSVCSLRELQEVQSSRGTEFDVETSCNYKVIYGILNAMSVFPSKL